PPSPNLRPTAVCSRGFFVLFYIIFNARLCTCPICGLRAGRIPSHSFGVATYYRTQVSAMKSTSTSDSFPKTTNADNQLRNASLSVAASAAKQPFIDACSAWQSLLTLLNVVITDSRTGNICAHTSY
ncbi:unnamed protein product, partial [Ectocarpus sp. 12 AP-2014]